MAGLGGQIRQGRQQLRIVGVAQAGRAQHFKGGFGLAPGIFDQRQQQCKLGDFRAQPVGLGKLLFRFGQVFLADAKQAQGVVQRRFVVGFFQPLAQDFFTASLIPQLVAQIGAVGPGGVPSGSAQYRDDENG